MADSSYADGELKDPPPAITWTTRLCKDPLFAPPPVGLSLRVSGA